MYLCVCKYTFVDLFGSSITTYAYLDKSEEIFSSFNLNNTKTVWRFIFVSELITSSYYEQNYIHLNKFTSAISAAKTIEHKNDELK